MKKILNLWSKELVKFYNFNKKYEENDDDYYFFINLFLKKFKPFALLGMKLSLGLNNNEIN